MRILLYNREFANKIDKNPVLLFDLYFQNQFSNQYNLQNFSRLEIFKEQKTNIS